MTYTTQVVNTDFTGAGNIEFNGLVDNGAFTRVPDNGAHGHRICSTHFVDQTKNTGMLSASPKPSLVVQAFNDKAHGMLTNARTVQLSSQRITFHAYASDPELALFIRHMS